MGRFAMFVDATKLPQGETIQADICIVGAGAAGITLARDMANGHRRIALFESGGLEYSDETQKLYAGESVGQDFPPLEADRLRYFGGTTNHWSGGCRPFDALDLEGWPFGREALDPYYRAAQKILQLGPFAYDPKEWEDGNDQPLSFGAQSRILTGIFQYSPPTRFGTVYRRDLERAEAVTVYLSANLVDIDTDEHAREVTGLQLACLKGPRFRATAKYYVLAAGGIENARLLLTSNRVQKAGLGNGNDLVGRYFMDHADVFNAATVLFNDAYPALAFYNPHTVRGQNVQGFLFASADAARREGLPPFCIGIQAGSMPDKELAKKSLLAVYHSIAEGHVPEHLGFHLVQMARGVEWAADDIYNRLRRNRPRVFSTIYSCGAPPDRDSRVTLSDATDALGVRRVRLDWRLPSDFEQSMQRAHEILGEELGRAGLGRLRINSAETGPSPMQSIENAHHHMGTTRMDRSPSQGVVDENCRVHGIANLFVAGSSVFPTYSFDNPTMTIVALALRLSDHLKQLSA